MKIVIQCSSTKNALAGTFALNGRRVKFVAHPELHPQDDQHILFRPDDPIPSSSMTWREYLVAYNDCGENSEHLLQAGALYSPPAYRALLGLVGAEDLYILSAGWGLIRSDFLLPDYDITFSSNVEKWKRRTKLDVFHDFAYLTEVARDETVYFFGGKAYLPLYYELTRSIVARKIVYFASNRIIRDDACQYIQYNGTGTNWHYRCISDFLAEAIAK